MSAQLARLHALPVDIRPERRKASRYPAEVNAVLTSSHGDEADVQLADVSTHGCNVRGVVDWLRTGSFVSIGFDDETPLHAIVRWTRGDAAGMEFLQPIPPERTEWHALINSPFGA
jgi:hypothetical protein